MIACYDLASSRLIKHLVRAVAVLLLTFVFTSGQAAYALDDIIQQSGLPPNLFGASGGGSYGGGTNSDPSCLGGTCASGTELVKFEWEDEGCGVGKGGFIVELSGYTLRESGDKVCFGFNSDGSQANPAKWTTYASILGVVITSVDLDRDNGKYELKNVYFQTADGVTIEKAWFKTGTSCYFAPQKITITNKTSGSATSTQGISHITFCKKKSDVCIVDPDRIRWPNKDFTGGRDKQGNAVPGIGYINLRTDNGFKEIELSNGSFGDHWNIALVEITTPSNTTIGTVPSGPLSGPGGGGYTKLAYTGTDKLTDVRVWVSWLHEGSSGLIFNVSDKCQTAHLDPPIDLSGASSVAAATTLTQNFPNPFASHTTIDFSLQEAGHVSLVVYDMLGRQVKTLVSGGLEAGLHQVTWDGRDSSGGAVATGSYFYKLNAGGLPQTKKMVLVR